jgi:hypothetical protein
LNFEFLITIGVNLFPFCSLSFEIWIKKEDLAPNRYCYKDLSENIERYREDLVENMEKCRNASFPDFVDNIYFLTDLCISL